MSKVAFLVAGMSQQIPVLKDVDYIGIDSGALLCMNQNILMTYAIGDFDSISKEDFKKLKTYTTCIKLNPEKNETDSEAAILLTLEKGYDSIILYGGLGGRIDHELANLRLMIERNYPIELWNEANRLKVLNEGKYFVKKGFKYLSFLALKTSVITEKGVKYPLEKCTITPNDIFTVSNEVIEQAEIIIHSGKVLMIESNQI